MGRQSLPYQPVRAPCCLSELRDENKQERNDRKEAEGHENLAYDAAIHNGRGLVMTNRTVRLPTETIVSVTISRSEKPNVVVNPEVQGNRMLSVSFSVWRLVRLWSTKQPEKHGREGAWEHAPRREATSGLKPTRDCPATGFHRELGGTTQLTGQTRFMSER